LSKLDPNWTDLQKELNKGPFHQRGFTKQLQLQIEQNLERPYGIRKARIFKLAAVASFLLLLFLSTQINWTNTAKTSNSAAKPAAGTTTFEEKQISTNNPVSIKSVLLLGLRTDKIDNNYSTYRTIMITGDQSNHQQLIAAANGSGILVPIGQQFWKIDAMTKNAENNYLFAYPVNDKAAKRIVSNPTNETLKHNEKLLFAGNKYISLVENDQKIQNNKSISSENVWTMDIQKMNELEKTNDPAHISLQNIFGNQASNAIKQLVGGSSQITGEKWTLTRQNGKWVPQVAEETTSSDLGTSFTLHTLPLTLPNSIVSYDQLVASWEAIKQIQPKALDAVSSPDHDMIAIMTADKLYIYPVIADHIGPLSLQLDLNKNEAMVMAQWATAKYADNWLAEGMKYLKN
jgi:putative AlgH/UPF0301 family transcriptional regulator